MLGDTSHAMLGNNEISVGWPISTWFYSTQIHKFFIDVFALKGNVANVFKDFYWLMLLN